MHQTGGATGLLFDDKSDLAALRLQDVDPAAALQAVADLTSLAVQGIVAQHPELVGSDGRHDLKELRRLWNHYER